MLEFDVCGEDQDRGLWELLADHACRVEALGGVRGRHPNIDHSELGSLLANGGDQLRTVPALTHDVEAGSLEEAREALAEENFVVREHNPCPARGHGHHYPLPPCM